jgi:hypothetical protein
MYLLYDYDVPVWLRLYQGLLSTSNDETSSSLEHRLIAIVVSTATCTGEVLY